MKPAGLRRQLIHLSEPATPVADGDGSYTATEQDLSPATAWASIEPATAQRLERIAAGTVVSTATHLVSFPYHGGVTTKTIIRVGTQTLKVLGASDPELRHLETIAICAEQVA